MQYTENLQLAKYESNDVTSYLEVANANMTKIDAGHGTLNTQVTANTSAIGDAQEDINNMAPQIADASTKANAGLSNTANVYDATQTYAVGDYTLYNNNLYRCDVPIPQAESFDGTKWTRVKTSDEIKTCKRNITQLTTDLNNKLKWTLHNQTVMTNNTIVLNGDILNADELMVVVNGEQIQIDLDNRMAHNNNILTASESSYGLPYWETIVVSYHIDTHQLEVYATTYEGTLSTNAFIYYR